MAHARRHAHRRAGYSLVEMMVALTAGIILVSSGYVLTASSSRFFHRTSRVATTQATLRLAAEQLRADIARAGFLAHPDTNGQTACGQPVANGISTMDGTANTVRAVELARSLAGPDDNQVRHDQLTLTGNYVTNERYDLRASADLQNLRLDPDDNAFRRSFVSMDGTSYDNGAFTDAFAQGRLVRVEVFAPQRHTFFRTIATSTAGTAGGTPLTFTAAPVVTLATGLPQGCGISPNNLDYAFIAPVTTVDYQMIPSGSFEDERLGNLAETTANGADMEFALVRREWDYDEGDWFANSHRIALTYGLEFGLTALYCTTVGAPCAFNNLQARTNLTGINPAQIQGLRVTLAARTPDVDRRFDPQGAFDRGTALSGNPLRSWTAAGAQGTGRSRVRSTTFDVALPNNQP